MTASWESKKYVIYIYNGSSNVRYVRLHIAQIFSLYNPEYWKIKIISWKIRRYFENKSSCVHERLLEKLRYSVFGCICAHQFTYFLPLPHTPWPSLLDWLLYSMYPRIFWIFMKMPLFEMEHFIRLYTCIHVCLILKQRNTHARRSLIKLPSLTNRVILPI